jgi:hypothetical protein
MVYYQKNTDEVMQFFFYINDIERCVKGTKRRWVKSKPDVPNVWPVKIGTNLSRKEILDLEHVGFQRALISLRRLFEMKELPSDLSSYPIPAFPDDHSKTRLGKNIRRNKNAPTTKHANNCTSSLTLKSHLCQVTMIPHQGFGCSITLDSRVPPKVQSP